MRKHINSEFLSSKSNDVSLYGIMQIKLSLVRWECFMLLLVRQVYFS